MLDINRNKNLELTKKKQDLPQVDHNHLDGPLQFTPVLWISGGMGTLLILIPGAADLIKWFWYVWQSCFSSF